MFVQEIRSTSLVFSGLKPAKTLTRKTVSVSKEAPKGVTKTLKNATKEDPELVELFTKFCVATAIMQTTVGGSSYTSGYFHGLNASS